jgi:hypothetical protein
MVGGDVMDSLSGLNDPFTRLRMLSTMNCS